MELWTALLLGVVGSGHCAGMCGPLALALPGNGNRAALATGRVVYNLGRIITYSVLGAIFGLIGHSLALGGFQRWVSIAAGITMLSAVFVSTRPAFGMPAIRFVDSLKSIFAKLLKRRTLGSMLGLGLLNGMLPCGLVYTACAGATASSHLADGIVYMLVFGAGTTPVMLALSLVGPRLQFGFRLKLQRLIPTSLAIVGSLLILRGLALGIPYLSPEMSGACSACQ